MKNLKNMKLQKISILALVFAFALIFGVVIFMNIQNTSELENILQDSIRSQLISISVSARDLIDVEQFDRYNSREDILADADAHTKTLKALRSLQEDVGVKYIYVLKRVGEKYYFVFDTDVMINEVFLAYEPSPVHEQAFLGKSSADIMNVVDEYGSFNTGAVPIWKDGEIIGIVSVDSEDSFLEKSSQSSRINAVLLVVTMLVSTCMIAVVVAVLMHRLQKMQETMFKASNFDLLTGLPNRQYLMDYLATLTAKNKRSPIPFALLFIDLDNFKHVNDHAGHDAGDELLRHIAGYLDRVHESSKAFRPSAGMLNVSTRIGGDEFVQVVQNVTNQEEAELIAQDVLDQFMLKTPHRFIEKYEVGLSIGVALFPYHTDDYNVLIRYADIAMFHAKRRGRNHFCVYRDGLKKDE